MELSSRLSAKQVPLFPTRKSFPKSLRMNAISCRATTSLNPPTISSTNYYEILSLDSEKVGFDDIKKAYRSLARQYHPDVVHPSRKEESTKMFMEVQKAYETLSNPNSRRRYDFELGYLSRCGSSGQGGKSEFDKEVWADQLSDLEFKSNQKRRRKQPRAAACV